MGDIQTDDDEEKKSLNCSNVQSKLSVARSRS